MALFESLKSLLGADDEEVNGVIQEVRSSAPDASDDQILKTASELLPAAQNGTLDKEISNRHVASKYGLQQRNALEAQIAKENEGPNFSAGLAALGAGLSGGNAAAAGQSIINNQKQDQANRLNQFDDKAKLEKGELLAKEEDDPNSEASKMAQSLAVQMGIDPALAGKLTASRFKSLSPVLEKKYQIEQNKLAKEVEAKSDAEKFSLQRADLALKQKQLQSDKDARIALQAEKDAEKKSEKEFALTTPFGLANSVEDAKKLKDASESKSSFDNKIDQMIALREKHGGGATLNRDDVARGKQLSKDLLLEYKNMAKLGVLSQADEAIINAIIPEDPLEYNSPLAAIQGQDPTLARLKSFKADSNKDFSNRVATRVRGGGNSQLATQPPAGPPKAGTIEDGYRFKGGDPKDPTNWEQMGSDPMLAAGGK